MDEDGKGGRERKNDRMGTSRRRKLLISFGLVVVINEADGLTKEAQHALRRTMEKYTANMRVILCCNSISKIIGPIRSRCLLIRVPLPTEVEVGLPIKEIS
jgi:replication factor C subunit 3/5